jgi:hypothetical protein
MKFSSEYQPEKRGRPKGSKNRRSLLSEATVNTALEALDVALQAGEPWAIQAVIDRISPRLKPITPVESIDGRLIECKIAEISELEERIRKLEQMKS